MNILVAGAGMMAHGLVYDMISKQGVSKISVVDIDERQLVALKKRCDDPRVEIKRLDISDSKALAPFIKGRDCVVNATHYRFNYDLSLACIKEKSNFCDMGGNVDMVEKQFTLDSMAKEAGVTVIPDCGLAPGMVNIASVHFADEFEEVESIKLRVGGVPQKPRTMLNYQLVFSVEGLINEYLEKAIILKDGELTSVDSMTEVEEMVFRDPFGRMEAFYTSGGTSTLPKTLKGKIKNVDYKTIRYPGHCRQIKLLLDLGLASSEEVGIGPYRMVPRKLLGKLLEKYLPSGEPDAVLVRIELTGKKHGNTVRENYELIDLFDEKASLSAMQRTTAFPVSIIAMMLGSGKIEKKGVTPQEVAVPRKLFISELEERGIKFAKV